MHSDVLPTTEKDAPEPWPNEWQLDGQRSLTANLRISYWDRAGKMTHRRVTVQRYGLSADWGGGVMVAHCHLQDVSRPFRLLRITHAVDLDVGERIDNLPAWLEARYAQAPVETCDRFVDAHQAALGALLFVAKADSALRSKERDVFAQFCVAQGLKEAHQGRLVVERVAEWRPPRPRGYDHCLRAVAGRERAYCHSVLQHAMAIVATDKTVWADESIAIERMRRELGLFA